MGRVQLALEQPVIVEVCDGVGQPGLLHLPVVHRVWRTGLGPRSQALSDYKDLPLAWEALCGAEGYLYLLEGLLLWRMCGACAEAATAGRAVGWWEWRGRYFRPARVA